MSVIEKIFGTHSSRELKRIEPLVDKIEALRPTMQALSDEELRGKTEEYKKRLTEGETLDDLLPEAFATVREAARLQTFDDDFEFISKTNLDYKMIGNAVPPKFAKVIAESVKELLFSK